MITKRYFYRRRFHMRFSSGKPRAEPLPTVRFVQGDRMRMLFLALTVCFCWRAAAPCADAGFLCGTPRLRDELGKSGDETLAERSMKYWRDETADRPLLRFLSAKRMADAAYGYAENKEWRRAEELVEQLLAVKGVSMPVAVMKMRGVGALAAAYAAAGMFDQAHAAFARTYEVEEFPETVGDQAFALCTLVFYLSKTDDMKATLKAFRAFAFMPPTREVNAYRFKSGYMFIREFHMNHPETGHAVYEEIRNLPDDVAIYEFQRMLKTYMDSRMEESDAATGVVGAMAPASIPGSLGE